MAGFSRHIKGLDVEGKRSFAPQNIKGEDGKHARDPVLIPARLPRWFHKVLNIKLPTLNPRMIE